MSDQNVLRRLQQVAERHLDYGGTLRLEQNLVEDLELDSIRLLTLAVEVENEFHVFLSEEIDLITVGDLVAEITRQLAAEGQ